MKFYSHANKNKSYHKTVSLAEVRSVEKTEYRGTKSAIRFVVNITYKDGTQENFDELQEEESFVVYSKIIKILNENTWHSLDGMIYLYHQEIERIDNYDKY